MAGITFETPDLQDELVAEAWKLVAEALREGKMTLSTGKTILLDPRDLVKHAQWLASQGKRKGKAISKPREGFIRQTE